jgi:hypothetical protein
MTFPLGLCAVHLLAGVDVPAVAMVDGTTLCAACVRDLHDKDADNNVVRGTGYLMAPGSRP